MHVTDRFPLETPARAAADANPPLTLDTWRDPARTVRSFRAAREFIPSARIRGARSSLELPRIPRDVSALVVGPGGETLAQYLDRTRAAGILVVHDGAVVHERLLRGFSADQVHMAWSVSKSIVSSLAGILVGDGSFAPGDGVADRLPELRGTAWDGVIIRNLLDMRVGLAWDENDGSADVLPYDRAYQWASRVDAPESALEYMRALPRGAGPGGVFDYQSIATDMLAWVIEATTGQRLHELLAERLWIPLGASDAEITLDYFGNPMADGGISAGINDLALFGELWRSGGANRRGERLIPADWIHDTLTPTADLEEAFARSGRPDGRPGSGRYYRNNWWVLDAASGFFAARGFLGQSIHVHRDARVTVVTLSAWEHHDTAAEADAEHVALRIADELG